MSRGGVQPTAHLLSSYRQRKETDQIAAQITDIQGQLKGIQEQNRYVQMLSAAKTNRRLIVAFSARDSCLKQVWDHVRKLNQWAAEAREMINGKSLPSPAQCGPLDV
jgi:D-alanyl-D-alanine carboxypeptidase